MKIQVKVTQEDIDDARYGRAAHGGDHSCPIKRALRRMGIAATVGWSSVGLDESGLTTALPPEARKFVHAFDGHQWTYTGEPVSKGDVHPIAFTLEFESWLACPKLRAGDSGTSS